MSQEEFCDGERANPYPSDMPAARRRLKAVPESKHPLLVLSTNTAPISAAVRHLGAPQGEVWIPDTALQRLSTCRFLVWWLVVVEVALVVLATVGSSIALLAFLVVLFVALPISIRALRQAQVFAFIDSRTGLVGVEDGLSRPRPPRR